MPEQSLDTMERDDLLRLVQQCSFMMQDLALYLDTHPTDKEALSRFMMHRDMYQQYADAYAARFGALCQKQIGADEGWPAWSNTPFPWEKEAN